MDNNIFVNSLPARLCPKLALGGYGKREKHEPHTFWAGAVYRKPTSEFRCPGRD